MALTESVCAKAVWFIKKVNDMVSRVFIFLAMWS
jgi:hypothetical protein